MAVNPGQLAIPDNPGLGLVHMTPSANARFCARVRSGACAHHGHEVCRDHHAQAHRPVCRSLQLFWEAKKPCISRRTVPE